MFVCLGCSWSGPAGGCCLRKIWGRLVVLHCGVGWLVVCAWCRRHACCWLVVVGASACFVCVGVARCRGSGAVRPGCLTRVLLLVCGWLGLGVGGLVVNCIVDASILL